MTTHTEQFTARPFLGAWAFFNRGTPVCSGRTREEAEKMASDANLEWVETAKRERLHDAAPALLAALEGVIPVAEAYSERLGAGAIVRIDQARAAIAAAKAP